MYAIVLEIQNFPNLMKLKREKMTSLIHELQTTIGSVERDVRNDFLLYSYSENIKSLAVVINRISKLLYEGSFLHGVNIYVTDTHDLEPGDISDYSPVVLSHMGLNQTCLSRECAKELMDNGLGECKECGNGSVWQLVSLSCGSVRQKKHNKSEYEKIIKNNLAEHPGNLFFHTGSEGQNWLLAESVEGSIDIVFNENHVAGYKPFLRINTSASYDEAVEVLLPEERAIIEKTDRLYQRSEYTWNLSDVYLRLSVLLKGFGTSFSTEKKKIPLQIINTQYMTDVQQELIVRVFKQKDIESRFRLILYGAPGSAELLSRSVDVEKIEVERISEERSLNSWVEEFADETSRSICYGIFSLHSVLPADECIRTVSRVLDIPVKKVQRFVDSAKAEKLAFGTRYLYFPGAAEFRKSKNDLFLKREVITSLGSNIMSSGKKSVLSFENLTLLAGWNHQQIKIGNILGISLQLLRYNKFEQIGILFTYLYDVLNSLPGLDLLNDFVCFKKYMARNEMAQAEKLYKRLLFFDDTSSILYGHIRLALGEFHYNTAKYKECLEIAKKLVFHVQESDGQQLEAPAQMLIGHAMLKLGKTSEAIEYFSIAVEEAKSSVYPGDYTHALISKATALYMRGNYSMAVRTLDAAAAGSENEGFILMRIYCLFFSGRCHFTVGQYDDALLLFQESLAVAGLHGFSEWEEMLQLWMGRCYGYMRQFDRAFQLLKSLPRSAESLLFTGECHYFYDHLREARTIIHEALEESEELLPEPNQYLIVKPEHGYYEIEGRAFNNPHTVLQRRIASFWAYLENQGKTNEEALDLFSDLLKSENTSGNDPYIYFYYLCYSLTHKLQNHDDVLEYLTVLSKGIRHIQGIAARIDDVDKRLSFLHKAYWTKTMIEAGKVHKLT